MSLTVCSGVKAPEEALPDAPALPDDPLPDEPAPEAPDEPLSVEPLSDDSLLPDDPLVDKPLLPDDSLLPDDPLLDEPAPEAPDEPPPVVAEPLEPLVAILFPSLAVSVLEESEPQAIAPTHAQANPHQI